jgi:O-acetyl-ADP-ribose deacetylase (regulator of RNase III)
MIRYMTGNIFDTSCCGIVNPVNCVGVMGAGLALQFKNFYPRMFSEYKQFCKNNQVVVGRLNLHYLNAGQQVIINFPTKVHWRNPSKMEYLVAGLQTFVASYKDLGVDSVAFPLLGVGNGGLAEDDVVPVMVAWLSQCDIGIEIWRFNP